MQNDVHAEFVFIFIWRRKVFLCSPFSCAQYLSGTKEQSILVEQSNLPSAQPQESFCWRIEPPPSHWSCSWSSLWSCNRPQTCKMIKNVFAKTMMCLTQLAPCYKKKDSQLFFRLCSLWCSFQQRVPVLKESCTCHTQTNKQTNKQTVLKMGVSLKSESPSGWEGLRKYCYQVALWKV